MISNICYAKILIRGDLMEKFLNKKVIIIYFTGEYSYRSQYKGVVTSLDDEFICLDEKIFIARKFIISIVVK